MKLLNKFLIVSVGFAMAAGGCIVGASSIKAHANAAGTTYTKVTSAPADWSGNYLVVNEETKTVFTGLSDDTSNAKSITIADGTISGSYSDYEITLASMSGGNYSVKNSAGKYLAGSKGANKIVFGTDAAANTISFSDGNVTIVSNSAQLNKNGGANQFRYYGKSSQKPIQLYKAGAPAELTGISVKTAPTKTKYVVGETFDPTGMVIEGSYDDETTGDIKDYTFTPDGALTKADTSITISYKGKTCSQPISVVALTEVSLTGSPVTKEYFEGQQFDPTGVTVTATYDDDTTADVTAFVQWGELVKGAGKVDGTYAGHTITVNGLLIKAPAGYSKVTKASELKANDSVILVYETGLTAAGSFDTKYFTPVNIAINDGFITPTEDVVIFTLKGSEGAWGLYCEHDEATTGYVKSTGTSNQNMGLENSMSDYSTWNITFDGSKNAIIKNKKNTSMGIQYNAGAPRFTCYSSQTPIQLYKLSGSVEDAINSVTLDKTEAQNIIINGSTSLTATVNGGADANKNVKWSSSDNSVAAISTTESVSGTAVNVTGLKEGTATITAKAAGDETKTASINITVVDPNNVKTVTLDKHIIGFTIRPTCDPITLTTTVTPTLASHAITWSSSDPAIASVSSTGVVTAGEKAGIATITAKSTVKPAVYDTCDVVVFTKKGQEATPVQVSDISYMFEKSFYPYDTFESEGYPIYFEGIVNAIDKNNDGTYISVTLEDANDATKIVKLVDAFIGDVTTEISVGTKLTVHCDEGNFNRESLSYNKIKNAHLDSADNSGLALVNITLGGSSTVKVGHTTGLIVTYAPSYTNERDLIWLTSNSSVATVADGVVTGVSEGEVTITARSAIKNTIEDTFTLTVVPATKVDGTYVLSSKTDEYTVVDSPIKFAANINGFDGEVFACGYDTKVTLGTSSGKNDIYVGAGEQISLSLIDQTTYAITEVVLVGARTTENNATVTVGDVEWNLTKTATDYYVPVFNGFMDIVCSNKTLFQHISIKVAEVSDDNAVEDLGQTMLDMTYGPCSAQNITKEVWDNMLAGIIAADAKYSGDIAAALKNMTADQDGTTMEQALARYDYIFAKYGEVLSLTNLLDRTIVPMSSYTMLFKKNNNLLLIVAITSVAAISLVGLFFIIRKKKHI